MLGVATLLGGPSAMAYWLPMPYPFCVIGTVCVAIPGSAAWQDGLRETARQASAWLLVLAALGTWGAGVWLQRLNPSFWNP
jgi:hypothetical protein